jgi:hypothetical protein
MATGNNRAALVSWRQALKTKANKSKRWRPVANKPRHSTEIWIKYGYNMDKQYDKNDDCWTFKSCRPRLCQDDMELACPKENIFMVSDFQAEARASATLISTWLADYFTWQQMQDICTIGVCTAQKTMNHVTQKDHRPQDIRWKVDGIWSARFRNIEVTSFQISSQIPPYSHGPPMTHRRRHVPTCPSDGGALL